MQFTNFTKKDQVSPLENLQSLTKSGRTPGAKSQSAQHVLLPLTSLIDAFSIIVIYLLIGTQGGDLDQDIPSQLNLPIAESGIILDKETPTVRIEKGLYYVDEKPVAINELAQRLAALKQKVTEGSAEILIQADQAMDYVDLDPLLRATSAAGIQKLKFAVIPK